ncbi:hypothetical protein, partial [Methylobacterium sp. Leaf100]|uniref:DUF6894 family protein n=1 Tax=Methylobacterium sp. Leaf100 TaxID=1736252 RepID=UPI001AEBB303
NRADQCRPLALPSSHDRRCTNFKPGPLNGGRPTLEAAIVQAKRVLPTIAADEVPRDGEHKIYTVVVTDEDGSAVYTAGLSFSGTWLIR